MCSWWRFSNSEDGVLQRLLALVYSVNRRAVRALHARCQYDGAVWQGGEGKAKWLR